MGEIFKKEQINSALPCTEERFSDGHGIEAEIEHYHRYFFARSYCRDKEVLDIASGEGYGSAILAQVASSVVGIDISEETVSHAQAVHARPNLKYLAGDVRKIPLQDHSVDVVVSFETLEHFYEHDLFMQEVKRVLRPDGCLIISTPNSDVYSAVGIPANPYHINELTRDEFSILCKKYFKYMSTVNQRTFVGSVLIGDSADSAVPMVFEARGKEYVESSKGLSRAFYLVSILSDVNNSFAHNSIFIHENIGSLLSSQVQFLYQTIDDNKKRIRDLEYIIAEQNKHLRQRNSIEYFKYRTSLIIRKRKLKKNAFKICNESTYFDKSWYLEQYPDVSTAGLNPVEHYINIGASEGRDPGPDFSTKKYFIENPEIQRAGINPLVYFEHLNKKQ
jgi:ubiquinone/menaquinone biosynthesis C-methylase UbiE